MQIRLALREEGQFWNAYLARADTMDNAKLIGSIAIGAVKKDPAAKETFKSLMQGILADAIQEYTGEAPSEWETRTAPEAERAGHS